MVGTSSYPCPARNTDLSSMAHGACRLDKKARPKRKNLIMEISTLLAQQFTDIFRLGLLAGLIYTTERTRSQTGVLLPLVAGVIFVAVIIPSHHAEAGRSAVAGRCNGHRRQCGHRRGVLAGLAGLSPDQGAAETKTGRGNPGPPRQAWPAISAPHVVGEDVLLVRAARHEDRTDHHGHHRDRRSRTRDRHRCCRSGPRSRRRLRASGRRTSRCRCDRAATGRSSGCGSGRVRPASRRSGRTPSSRG